MLSSSVSASYISTVIAMTPTLKTVTPHLYQLFVDQLSASDSLYVGYAYDQLLGDFYWHDGSPDRGKAPFTIPKNVRTAVTTAPVKEKHFMTNRYSRERHLVLEGLDAQCKPGTGTRVQQKWAKWQRARFVSAGGKMAYHWLGLLPRKARITRLPQRFESHLFRIALQYRSGLPCVPGSIAGARCRCNVKEAGTGERSIMDEYGHHLSACPWGGWRISRHDGANGEVGDGIRGAGNNATWTDIERILNALPSHRKEPGSRTRRHRVADIVSVDQNNQRSVFDIMITRSDTKAKEELRAAKAGEKMKLHKYETFLQRCAEEDPTDPRLQTAIIPIVFETHGAAGPMACRLFSLTRHQYGNVVLPCEDKSSEQIFYAAWMHRISTAIQRGTALMIHNIAQGNRTKSRRTKDVDVEPNAGDDSDNGGQDGAPGVGGHESNSEIDFTEKSGGESDGGGDNERKGVDGKKRVPSELVIKAARARRARRGASNIDKHTNVGSSDSNGKA